MAADIGRGWLEIQNLKQGMTLGRRVLHFPAEGPGEMLPFAEVKSSLSEPTLLIQAVKTGRILLKERCVGIELIGDTETTLFQYVTQVDYLPLLDTSKDIEVAILYVSISTLHQLLGEEITDKLLTDLQIESAPNARSVKVPPHISAILHASHSSQLKGEMRKLFARAKVLEYFCTLADYFHRAKTSTETSLTKKIIFEIYKELTQLEGKIPTLCDIAQRYGISMKSLNSGFKEMFGKTAYACITEQRLHDAHSLLLSSDIAMKALADRLGYSHVNHFITAFKKSFGYTPGSLRKKHSVSFVARRNAPTASLSALRIPL